MTSRPIFPLAKIASKLFPSTRTTQIKRNRLRKFLKAPESLESRRVMAGDIAGTVFDDVNGNGINDPAENGIPGWTLFVDNNGDGTFNPGEPSTVSDAKGKYAIVGLPAVRTTIYEIPAAGYLPTPGFSDHVSITVRDNREVRVSFPNVNAALTTGTVRGTLYEDDNLNGTKDSGEHGITGWTVFLDANGDGVANAGERTAVSDTDGDYLFENVTPGSYSVYEIPQGGMQPVGTGLFPLNNASDHQAITVTAGNSSRADFANLLAPVGNIRGTVWNDLNGDGIRGAGELPLANQSVFLDLNGNGALDADEPSRLTDANGNYAVDNIRTEVYQVISVSPAGMVPAYNSSNSRTINLTRGATQIADFYHLIANPGSLTGSVWNDSDGNGFLGATENGLSDWQVYLDANGDGVLDASDPVATTDATGKYQFTNVRYGLNTVRLNVTPNWLATNPSTASTTVLVLSGETRATINFGARENVGNIQGTVWNDANGDRARTASESGLSDWTVYLDINRNGSFDTDEPSTTTDASGAYRFTRVLVGNYQVNEILPAGWIVSEGRSASANVNVTLGNTLTADFLNLVPTTGSVSGVVWSDLDSDGLKDIGESGISGWQVYVDINKNNLLDSGEPQSVSDIDGNYSLTEVPYGTNVLREKVQPGFTATNPLSGSITSFILNGEARTGVNFGAHELTEFTIQGTVFHDQNKDGIRDATETGISGVTVYLDLNNNNLQDATEPTAISSNDLFFTPAVNELGNYSFTHLARGSYTVREVVPAALGATPDAARQVTLTIGPGSTNTADFASQYRANEIHGLIYDDTDADKIHDANEYGRPGIGVYIDLDRDDVYDVDEPRTVTGDDGSYAFTGLVPGAYIVREIGPSAGPQTYPTTGGGILWPAGTSHAARGIVTPSEITTSLTSGQSYTQNVSLTLPGAGTLANMVDVFLLFDDTGSFTANSPIVRDAFPTIISQLQGSLPGIDLGFGVGRLEEYGSFAAEFATGRPFVLNQPIVASSTPGFSTAIQGALNRMAPGYGGDAPETDIEALYQLVTGLGFDGNNNGSVLDSGPAGLASTQLTPGNSGDVPSFNSFVTDPANNVLAPAGDIGGGGFRSGALPIILLATDTGFAYQPKGETSISGVGGLTMPVTQLTQASRGSTPFSSGAGIQETITGLNALGALVIGLGTNPEPNLAPREMLEAIAQLTGATNQSATTIANGTPDAIAPGDPMYFQINNGFGGTVADGVINAIQNAVTNVAMNITVRASDPRVKIINHTGTLLDVGAGQTASFDIEFIGDGKPHRFDLEFVREGTNVVLGSIPVVLGTPVVGDGYQYDELGDGEIHQSSHFGYYVANEAPSFVAGPDQSLLEGAGPQTITGWATNVSPGPATEAAQHVNFIVTSDNPALFDVQPSISADGTLTFTPKPTANGTAVVSVQAHDDGGIGLSGSDTSAVKTFVIQIAGLNSAPVASSDTYSVESDAILSVAAPGLLTNDADPDGDAITAKLIAPASNGVVALQADGSFSYTPVAGFSGTDSFSYAASDGTLDSVPMTVTISVTPIKHNPVAKDDQYSLLEDAALSITSVGVLGNDSDVDGDPLSASLVSPPAHGSVTLNADGSFSYTPVANYNGPDQFTYRISDGSLFSNVATVSLDITPVNDLPVANNNTYATPEDSTLNVAAPGILGNDVDVDGDSLTLSKLTDPLHGSLTLNADGSMSYTPVANYSGSDTFTYQVSDAGGVSNTATVTITVTPVNDAPVATNDAYTTAEDTTLSITLPGVLGNDSDIDSASISAIRVTAPLHGTVTLGVNGSFVYTPSLNYNGPDSFTYKANDGGLDSNIATVAINVTAVNDAPVAGNDAFTTDNHTALNIAAAGILSNDSDVEGSALSAQLVANPALGTVTLNANGSFVYTPNAGAVGVDTFTYRASDGVALSNLATVTITVTAYVPPTKFFVVDTDRQNTFQYSAEGATLTTTALNKSDSKPRGIASNAAGTTQWVVDGSGTIFVYDNRGTTLGQWTPQNVGKPEGITVWGNDLWLVDPSTDRVYMFAGGALLRTGRVAATSSFALSGSNLNSTDLVTDGSRIWVLNDTIGSDAVFRYSTSGALQGNWSLPTTTPSPTGLTLDPTNVNHLWVVDASTDRVYQYDGATSRISGTQAASASFALASTNTNPQGIADPLPLPPDQRPVIVPVFATDEVDAALAHESSTESSVGESFAADVDSVMAGPLTVDHLFFVNTPAVLQTTSDDSTSDDESLEALDVCFANFV